MLNTSKQSEANNRFDAKKYDRVMTVFPKGTREQIRALAAAEGVSLSRYIVEAVEQRSGLKLTLDGVLPWQREKQD